MDQLKIPQLAPPELPPAMRRMLAGKGPPPPPPPPEAAADDERDAANKEGGRVGDRVSKSLDDGSGSGYAESGRVGSARPAVLLASRRVARAPRRRLAVGKLLLGSR